MKVSLSKTVIGVAVSSIAIGTIGCQALPNPKNTQPVTDTVTVITDKDETNPLPAAASSPLLLYYFTPTLLMQRIYPVVTGRYVVQDNCLKFEQVHNNKTRLLTPLFDPTYEVSLLQNEQALILDGTRVKFGETVKTGGSVKEEYLFYHLQFDNPQSGVSESVRNPEDHVCLTEPGIFMRSKLID